MLVCRKHWCIHCCHQLKFGCLEKQRSVRNFLGTFKSRMKGIDSGYKLSGSADAIVNVTAVEFSFWAVVLTKKLMFDKTYEKIGVAGSHFSLFVVVTTE